MKRKVGESTSSTLRLWMTFTLTLVTCLAVTVRYRAELDALLGTGSCSRDTRSTKKTPSKTGYEAYKIEKGKLRSLERRLAEIMKKHPRPGDDHFGYNLTRSDEIPVSRDIVDARPDICRKRQFSYGSFPTVSVISPFFNEALTPLVRHVHALLTRTPPRLLADIILVDDKSTLGYLGPDLDSYFKELDPRIKVLRNEDRKGLILSRLAGAEVARGEVLVFLDAHMEVNHGWLEPLLERLAAEPEIVVQSHMPPILIDTFDLNTGTLVDDRGGFGWDLSYLWFPLPAYLSQFRNTDWHPIPFPVIQGGSIAVRKSYFEELGGFDPGLDIWGGEHFELSFNVWMTGGRIEIIPCSKVGHVYKDTKYSFGQEEKNYVVAKNNLRVAEVWMDEYKEFTRAALRARQVPEPVFTSGEWESIEERRKLRRRRGSKSFSWYLKNILPEQGIPTTEDILYGQIGSSKTRQCITADAEGFLMLTPSCKEFKLSVLENMFALDKWLRLKQGDKCVGTEEGSSKARLIKCPGVEGDHAMPYWTSNADGKLLYTSHVGTTCLTLVNSAQGPDWVHLQNCVQDLHDQRWGFMYHFKR